MTLDEAIKHAEEVAEEQEKLCKRYPNAIGYTHWLEYAEKHRQLAKWLKDYKRLLEQESKIKVLNDMEAAKRLGKEMINKMQVVIDIPEETYNDIQSSDWKNGELIFSEEWKAIHNGTPLPKGHGDLIDVNRKITVSTYDEQYEEWGEKTMTVLESLNKWSDEGVRAEDVVIPADKEGEE